ncbi:ABC transporter permease [Opitutaceae bacterium TAV4]|nr:ABC transporter permease [Opitutaceae bacterium TAV4]RRJ99307.1 ABC transporter permease [Opitutaceae bacterium TAV3]
MSCPANPSSNASSAAATADAIFEDGDLLRIRLGGRWRVTAPRPSLAGVIGDRKPRRIRIELAPDLERLDSALLLFTHEIRSWCEQHKTDYDTSALSPEVAALCNKLATATQAEPAHDRRTNLLTSIGEATIETVDRATGIMSFLGECLLSFFHLARRPRKFRWGDCSEEMQQCGAMALPIVGLISFLVGVIMAYQSAVLMRQFGADIYVADAVALVMAREMGAMMTGIILAGRTGAAFAATIGNMKANEEIDALSTFGIRPVDFLVLPRLVALALMMPLLTLYANALGIVGGMGVAMGVLDIPPITYWNQTVNALDLSDISTGLIKASCFGILVGLSGCHRGMNADRSASGVGRAATSAVVIGMLLIIIADAIFAVIFNALGW